MRGLATFVLALAIGCAGLALVAGCGEEPPAVGASPPGSTSAAPPAAKPRTPQELRGATYAALMPTRGTAVIDFGAPW